MWKAFQQLFASPSVDTPESVLVHVLDEARNAPRNFPSNAIRTSKYTLVTFLPYSLAVQLRKVSNLYFLVVMVIILIPGTSSLSPLSAVVPLCLVVGAAMVRDGLEDLRRHRYDARANGILTHVLCHGEWTSRKASDVVVGDVLRLKRGEEVPADAVLLQSSNDDGVAFILTANLDGESCAKMRRAKTLARLRLGTIDDLLQHCNVTRAPRMGTSCFADAPDGNGDDMPTNGTLIRVPMPNASLVCWSAQLTVVHDQAPQIVGIDIDQLLFRGTILTNTEWALAAVVYTGRHTKMIQNMRRTPQKTPIFSRRLNFLIFSMFVITILTVILTSGLSVAWHASQTVGGRPPWYLHPFFDRSGGELFGWTVLSSIVFLSYLIPMSLMVTLEITNTVQTATFAADEEMWRCLRGETRKSALRSSTLNSELAMVRHVFTDKTGTLTENDMVFVAGSVETVDYSASIDVIPHRAVRFRRCRSEQPMSPVEMKSDSVIHAVSRTPSIVSAPLAEALPQMTNLHHPLVGHLMVMALCNTVLPFEPYANTSPASDASIATVPTAVPGEATKNFQGSSLDEVALVRAAAAEGFFLQFRNSSMVEFEWRGTRYRMRTVATLEFSCGRKMMSVLVQPENAPEGSPYLLLTKGADSSVLQYSAISETSLKSRFEETLTAHASSGLRTLMFAYRSVSHREAREWLSLYATATSTMCNRGEAVERACRLLEHSLIPIGTTAIEDSLQDGVPRTIRFLQQADIVVWMLTGDKRETAVTIAVSSGLIPSEASVHHINVGDGVFDDATRDVCRTQMERLLAAVKNHPPRTVAFVIDGVSLATVLHTEDLSTMLAEIGRAARCAICCRLSPKQKADIVALFQRDDPCYVALAIGDGANDTTMIQEAAVGVGIMGLEGSQAELAADVAIPRFECLQRLLAVHGRYAWYQNSLCTCYSLYKNFILTLTLVVYLGMSGYSGQTLFNSWLLQSINLLLTQLQPLIFGSFGKDEDDGVLMKDPSRYTDLRNRMTYFGMGDWVMWGLLAVLHSAVLIPLTFPVLWSETLTYLSPDLDHTSVVPLVVMLSIVDATAWQVTRGMSWLFVVSNGLPILAIPGAIALLNAFESFGGEGWFFRVFADIELEPEYYVYIAMGSALAVGGVSVGFWIVVEEWRGRRLRETRERLKSARLLEEPFAKIVAEASQDGL